MENEEYEKINNRIVSLKCILNCFNKAKEDYIENYKYVERLIKNLGLNEELENKSLIEKLDYLSNNMNNYKLEYEELKKNRYIQERNNALDDMKKLKLENEKHKQLLIFLNQVYIFAKTYNTPHIIQFEKEIKEHEEKKKDLKKRFFEINDILKKYDVAFYNWDE